MGTVIAIFDYAIAGLRMIVNDMNEWIKIECKSQLYYQSGVTKKFYIIQLLIRSKLMFCQVLVFISIQLILIVASSFLKAFIKKFKTKQEVFKQLVKINKPQTNKNSFIFITKLTGKTNRANLYYWNKFSLCSSRLDIETSYQKILDIPINYRQDIIICYHNPQFRVSQRIKKKIGIVKDIPGFIYNINALYKMKPFKNKYERIRTIEGIEKVMKLGTNVPMVKNKRRIQSNGVLENMKVLHNDFCDSKYKPNQLCEQQLGRVKILELDFINIELINLKNIKNDDEKIYRMQYINSIQVFKNLDIFGQNIQLNFNGQNQYQTATGGFFSLAIIAVIAFFFQQNIIDFLNRVEIHLNTQTIFDFNPDSIQFNEDNYMFALAVDQPNFIGRPFFNITIKQRIYTRSPNGTLNKDDRFIDLIPCTKDRFQKIFKNQDFSSQFSQLKLEEWLCPELNYSIKLGGSFTSEVFEFVKITVSECSNNSNSNSILSWKPECASTQARDRYLQQERSFRIRMYMTNNVINPLQVQNVSQTFFDDESYFSFLLSTGTEADVFYQKYNITTDDNIIPLLKKVDEEVINVKRAGDFKTKIVQNNDQQFSAIYLRRSPYTYIIRRELQDIADLLSYLGGFANIVAIIFGVIIKTYNKSRFMIELANHVYDFPMKNASVAESQERKEIKKTIAKAKSRTIVVQHQHQDQDLQSPIQSNKHSQNQLLLYDTLQNIYQNTIQNNRNNIIYQNKMKYIKSNQNYRLLIEQEKIIKQLGIQDRKSYFTQQIQKILNRSKPLLFNCKYILSKFFCSKLFYDRNSILLRKAIKKINKDLDICVILDTVKEINLIKELLLTQDQLILFDFAPKQVINLQEEEQKSMTRSLVRRSLESMRTNSNSQESQQQNETIFAYYKLFQAYDHIHQSLQQNNKINEKLIEKLGQEVKDIFEVSHFIQWDNKSIKCLKDDVQSDSVNSDPLCINNIEQIKINMNINT